MFDSDPGSLPETSHIGIVIARRRGADAADHEIERLVAADKDPARLKVVTSDRALIDKAAIDKVATLGAKVVSAGSFRAELDR